MSFWTASEKNGDLLHPSNVAIDSEGDVYVVDSGNNRVQIYDSDGEIITALHGDDMEFSQWAKEFVEANPDVVSLLCEFTQMYSQSAFRACGSRYADSGLRQQ